MTDSVLHNERAAYIRRCLRFACVICLLLASSRTAAQDRRVLVIGLDGVRVDALELAHTPNIDGLHGQNAGLLVSGFTEDLTFSGPSWSSILNGVHREGHGVDSNDYVGHDFTAHPNFLRRLKDFSPAIETAAFVTWGPLQTNFTDEDGTPDGVDHLVYHDRAESGDVRVVEDLVRMLDEGRPGAIFLYQNDIDGAGHRHGFSADVPEYVAQIEKTDSLIGKVLDAVERRPAYRDGSESWLFLVTSDHGGIGTGHRGNAYVQRHVPIIVSATDADVGPPCFHARTVDVTRTVLTYMGVPDELQAALDGRPIGFAPCPRPQIEYEENLIFNGSGELDAGFQNASHDQAITGWYDQQLTGARDGWHSMTLVRYDAGEGALDTSSPGPDQRGENFFAGGSKGANSALIQDLDVSVFRSDIDMRNVAFEMSGYLGGKAGQSDRMTLTAHFQNRDGHILGSATLGPVIPEDRYSQTELVYQSENGLVPVGTRSVRLLLQAYAPGDEDGIDAYADRLSFVIERRYQE